MPANPPGPTAFPWPPALLLAAVAGAMTLGRMYSLEWPGIDDVPARVIGIGLIAVGIALFVWAAHTLSRHKTTIIPTKPADALVTDGPFRFRRNPIYLADVLILIGVAILTQNLWFAILGAAFAVLVTWLAILPEERHLEARFGDAYRDYISATRRWI